jgi:hypothetical protein
VCTALPQHTHLVRQLGNVFKSGVAIWYRGGQIAWQMVVRVLTVMEEPAICGWRWVS